MPSCYQTRVINTPINEVWMEIKNFHDMSWAPNIVKSCEKIGIKLGSEIGARRLLNACFEETLQEINIDEHSFKYSIDEGPSPTSSKEISNYIGEVKLFSITQTDETFIEWKSSWDAKSKEAEEFCHTIYVAMMNDLNEKLKRK